MFLKEYCELPSCSMFNGAETITVDLNRKFKPTVVADARNLPFRSFIFGEVYLLHVLEHVIGSENISKDVHQALKKTIVTNNIRKVVIPFTIF